MDDLTWLDATALADLVRTRQVSPSELVEHAIARIERLNPALNAVVLPLYERARERAKRPLPQGPFTGVPFLVKDIMASIAGTRHSFGSRFLARYISTEDSELTCRLERAGLLIVGKTNTPELGILPTTEGQFLGPCKNPWDPTRTSGGSSGGAGVAVAAGLVPFAHGTDGGGSIRIPASCCGVFGLKPTRARNPLGPALGDVTSGLVVEHALTRSVRDSAALLDATSGPDLGDPYAAPPPARPFLKEVGADPGRLRIAVMRRPPTQTPVDPACLAAVDDAVRLLGELGHECVDAAPALDTSRMQQAFIAVYAAGAAAGLEGLAFVAGGRPAEGDLEPLTAAFVEMGRAVPSPMYLLSINFLQQAARRIAHFMVDYDLILTPTLAEPPPPLGSFDSSPTDPLAGFWRAASFTPFTPIANLTGQPAMSVPLHFTSAGLPIGSHFMARFGDEATLFRLAAQLEAARPWKDRHPPIAA